MQKKPDDIKTSFHAHTISVEDIETRFNSSLENGLSSEEVRSRQDNYGLNELREGKKAHWSLQLFRQFKSVVIAILVFAAVISAFVGEWVEAWAILGIVILNGVLGFVQESRAEKALAALRKMASPKSRAIRNGSAQVVPSKDLVIGDLIELEAGDQVPADARLIESYSFSTQESSLTGESTPVEKKAFEVFDANTPIGDCINMVFGGTLVLSGQAKAIVTSTGMNTELGKIAEMLESEEQQQTPLQKRLTELGYVIMYLCLAIVFCVAILQWYRGAELADVFIFAISLAVAAVPEGLPAVVTIALAFGLTRMAKRNALIRRLPSVETLGSVTVICSDKTGTLTRNEMTVRKIATADQVFELSGVGYEPIGNLTLEGSESPISGLDKYPGLHEALMSGIFCNNAKLLNQGTNWIISGDPTEGSLIVAAEKVNLSTTGSTLKAVYQIPFDSDRKMMSSIYEDESQNLKVFTKGALESVLGQCEKALLGDSIVDLTQELRSSIIASSEKMASGALRVLALANRVVPADERRDMELSHQLEAKLTFLGLAGMIDPPREEAKVAVKKCKEAGIKPVMITGDHPGTGLAIARELGIAEPDDKALTGKELDQLSEADLEQKVSQVSVYARVSPAHKHRVVNAWKNQGAIVAMTGDGVNDAPAIKSADIGIAMGITGTDVTKGASAMVLTDDNFATIVNAIEEGRGIFSNIQNITQFLLSANSGEILLILISTLIGWPTPLLPIQILWINLVTDSFPALALATERPEKGVMERPPRRVNEPIFTRERGLRILIHGFLLAFASGFSYWWSLYYNPSTLGNVNHAQAVAFCVCTFSQLAYSFACRSQGRTHLEAGVFSNLSLIAGIGLSLALQLAVILVPAIQPLFLDEPVTLSTTTWGVIIFAALSPVTLIELYKLMRKFFTSKSSAKNVEKSFSSRGVGT